MRARDENRNCRRLRLRLAVVRSLAGLLLALISQQSSAQRYLGGFDGRWEGSVSIVTTSYDESPVLPALGGVISIRLDITGEDVRVNLGGEQPLMGAPFRLTSRNNVALIYAGRGSSSEAESWLLLVTKKTQRDLIVVLSRAVSSTGTNLENPGFIINAMGELAEVAQ